MLAIFGTGHQARYEVAALARIRTDLTGEVLGRMLMPISPCSIAPGWPFKTCSSHGRPARSRNLTSTRRRQRIPLAGRSSSDPPLIPRERQLLGKLPMSATDASPLSPMPIFPATLTGPLSVEARMSTPCRCQYLRMCLPPFLPSCIQDPIPERCDLGLLLSVVRADEVVGKLLHSSGRKQLDQAPVAQFILNQGSREQSRALTGEDRF